MMMSNPKDFLSRMDIHCSWRNLYRFRSIRKGFNLVEIIVVLVIIAIAATLMIPMMSSADGIQVRSAANMIAADLEYAKSMAIGTQRVYAVVFDTSAESYQIQDPSGVIEHPVRKGFDYIVNFSTDDRVGNVDITQAAFGGSSRVEFDYFGSPNNGGSVVIGAGSDVATITVAPATGFITITE